MTITSFGTYVTTADEFIAHGTDVNADRLANSLPELALAGGYMLGDFTDDRDALDAKITALVGLENSIEQAIDDRDAQKANIRERLRQFRLAVRLNLKGTTYFKRVPTLPNEGASESKFLRPFDDMADMWTRINAETGMAGFTPPLLLTGGYSRAGFTTNLASVRVSYRAVVEAENAEGVARLERDEMLDPLKERMLQYRAAIKLAYGEGHPFTQSLPEIFPAPGSTPDAVTLSGVWGTVPTQGAHLTWTASTNPNLQVYQLRGCNGPDYIEDESNFITNMSPGTLSVTTLFGLVSPGDQATFKIIVILSTGNQAGSNAVTVTFP